jgi:hypothetical protein
MAKLRRDYTYEDSDLASIAREEFVKALVHGQEVQTGAHRRRTFSLNEYLKAISGTTELTGDTPVIVRQNVYLAGRR